MSFRREAIVNMGLFSSIEWKKFVGLCLRSKLKMTRASKEELQGALPNTQRF